MRVTVIPVDKTIIIDGNGVILESWPFEDDDIHAIQWEHNKGHIELKTNDPNIDLDDIDIVQPYIDEYMKEYFNEDFEIYDVNFDNLLIIVRVNLS